MAIFETPFFIGLGFCVLTDSYLLVTNTNRPFYKTMASQQDLMNPEAIHDLMLAYEARLPATVHNAILGGGSAAGISN